MRILYAIQGTGNGHVSRARDIVPLLKERADVDVLISGIQYDFKDLPFEVKYSFKGASFVFGKHGGINFWKTFTKNNPFRILKELNALPVKEYDLVVNDFEPISAWAAKRAKVLCVSLSHQSATLSPNAPPSKWNDWKGKFVLKHYAPVDMAYGFHFKAYDANISTPVIRKDIRNTHPTNKRHYTVYLQAYSDEVLFNQLSVFSDVKWEVFSKHTQTAYTKENVHFQPVSHEAFIQSFASCEGVLCGAGFEMPAEALFLKKKLIVIPMKGQYEQHLNAAALEDLGIPVIYDVESQQSHKAIGKWLHETKKVEVDFPDVTEEVIDNMLKTAQQKLL